MNKNLPSVEAIVREVLGDDVPETVTAIVHRLNGARLLTDPERSYGVVLHRRATGDWSREPRTELEEQAAAWDAACRRAQYLADTIRTECSDGRGLLQVQVERDRLLVSVQVTELAQWAAWRVYLGITEDAPDSSEYAHYGQGHREGVAVALLAYDAPTVQARAVAAATLPYRHGGMVYDLALPHTDAKGSVWDHTGLRADGMPLVVMRDLGTECALVDVIKYLGPLVPVREREQIPGVRTDAVSEFLARVAEQDPEELERGRATAWAGESA